MVSKISSLYTIPSPRPRLRIAEHAEAGDCEHADEHPLTQLETLDWELHGGGRWHKAASAWKRWDALSVDAARKPCTICRSCCRRLGAATAFSVPRHAGGYGACRSPPADLLDGCALAACASKSIRVLRCKHSGRSSSSRTVAHLWHEQLKRSECRRDGVHMFFYSVGIWSQALLLGFVAMNCPQSGFVVMKSNLCLGLVSTLAALDGWSLQRDVALIGLLVLT